MAAWFTAALPYIPDAINLARPFFTRLKSQDKPSDLVEKQIIELQEVATQNTESIKTLAVEMQRTIDALQLGSTSLARDLRTARTLSVIAATVALLAFCLAVYTMVIRT